LRSLGENCDANLVNERVYNYLRKVEATGEHLPENSYSLDCYGKWVIQLTDSREYVFIVMLYRKFPETKWE